MRENVTTADSLAKRLVQNINTERKAAGAQDLVLNEKLSVAAVQKQKHMNALGYWDHTSPEGVAPWSFVKEQNVSYATAAENLARGFSSTGDVVQGWMNSTEHKRAMLNSRFTQVGVSVLYNNGQYDAVAFFVEPAASIAAAGAVLSATESVQNYQTDFAVQIPDLEDTLDRAPDVLVALVFGAMAVGLALLLPSLAKESHVPERYKRLRKFHEQPLVHVSLYLAVATFLAGSHLL